MPSSSVSSKPEEGTAVAVEQVGDLEETLKGQFAGMTDEERRKSLGKAAEVLQKMLRAIPSEPP